MPYGHSLELRERVIAVWQAGESKAELARRHLEVPLYPQQYSCASLK